MPSHTPDGRPCFCYSTGHALNRFTLVASPDTPTWAIYEEIKLLTASEWGVRRPQEANSKTGAQTVVTGAE